VNLKDEGCDHVTCQSCKTDLCFVCSVERKQTLVHGKSFHINKVTITIGRVVKIMRPAKIPKLKNHFLNLKNLNITLEGVQNVGKDKRFAIFRFH